MQYGNGMRLVVDIRCIPLSDIRCIPLITYSVMSGIQRISSLVDYVYPARAIQGMRVIWGISISCQVGDMCCIW